MSDQRVRHSFWDNARQKSRTNDSCRMSCNTQRVARSQNPTGPTSEESTSSQPFENVRGGEAKRQRVNSEKVSASVNQRTPPSDTPLFKTSVDVGRRWHFTRGDGRRHRSKSVPFTVVSYNVLADYLLQSHPALYEECVEWVLQWEYRKKNLLKEILHYNADILCLQEVQEQHYIDWFEPELFQAGYHGLYKKRTGDKMDGCAIFYRTAKFSFLTVRNFNFRMEHVSIMDRDNVAMLALLHPKYKDGRVCSQTALCIANTHLLFNKKRGDIKLLQLVSLFAEIDKLKKEFMAGGDKRKTSNKIKSIPVVLCGDFNMTPFCALYHYIAAGTLNYNNLNKKELSGQSRENRHSFGDVLKNNIIPREMCLTNMSIWDDNLATNALAVAEISGVRSNDCERPDLTSSKSMETPSSTTNKQGMRSASCAQSEPIHQSNNTCESARQQQRFQKQPSSSSRHTNARQDITGLRSNERDWPSLRSSTHEPARQQRSFKENPSTSSQQLQSRSQCSDARQGSTSQELPKPIQYDPNCTVIHHRLFLWSAYRHFLQDRQREVTTYHGQSEPGCTVDYIFASPGRNEKCRLCRNYHSILELTGTLKLLSEEDVMLLGGLPSAVLSSDHLALVASYALHL